MTDISVTASFIDLVSFVERLHDKFPLSLKILCFVVVVYFVESKNLPQDNDLFRECFHKRRHTQSGIKQRKIKHLQTSA